VYNDERSSVGMPTLAFQRPEIRRKSGQEGSHLINFMDFNAPFPEQAHGSGTYCIFSAPYRVRIDAQPTPATWLEPVRTLKSVRTLPGL